MPISRSNECLNIFDKHEPWYGSIMDNLKFQNNWQDCVSYFTFSVFVVNKFRFGKNSYTGINETGL